MPTPITHEIRKRLEEDYDRRVAVQKARGIETIKAGAILAAQGDVGAGNALRILLKARGVNDDGFVRIVAAAHDAIRKSQVLEEFAARDYPTEAEQPLPPCRASPTRTSRPAPRSAGCRSGRRATVQESSAAR